jgi:hypothetical protein
MSDRYIEMLGESIEMSTRSIEMWGRPVLPVTAPTPLSLPVRDPAHVIKYLATVDSTKAPAGRAVAWLLQFKILPPDPQSWPSVLVVLVTSYHDLCPPLRHDDPPLWSIGFFADLGVDQSFFSDAPARFSRIADRIVRDLGVPWSPDFNHFLSVCAAVSAAFCELLSLSRDVAEAVCHALVRVLVGRIAWTDGILGCSSVIFEAIANKLEKCLRPTYVLLKQQQLDPKVYALRWILVLFAGQHSPKDLLIVWDFIFLHIDRLSDAAATLVVAHLNQCRFGVTQNETAAVLQAKTDFNFDRLIADTDKVMRNRPVNPVPGIPLLCGISFPLLVTVVASLILFRAFVQ